MISQPITAGSTAVRSAGKSARYYGVNIEPPAAGSIIVTIHDADGTTNATQANKIDQHVKFTGTDNWVHEVPGGQGEGIQVLKGLVAVVTNAGTAEIFFS